jgi:hypothetical protein
VKEQDATLKAFANGVANLPTPPAFVSLFYFHPRVVADSNPGLKLVNTFGVGEAGDSG